MLTFLSFFLGLTIGTWDVELAVDPALAFVEVRLDGEVVDRLEEAPWLTAVDFGRELRPHLLEAIGYDAGGNEVERIEQRINLPREQAEAGLVLERSEDGRRFAAASLVWRVVDGRPPTEMFIDFDGVALEVSDSGRAVLPEHDPEVIHIVSGEVVFGESNRAIADLAFGGVYGESVASKLTAVVLSRQSGKLPEVEDLQGRVLVDGAPVRVAAVERGRAEVIVARDSEAWVELSGYWLHATRSALRTRRGSAQNFVEAGVSEVDSVRLISTHPEFRREDDGSLVSFFPLSGNLNDQGLGGLSRVVLNLSISKEPTTQQSLSTAVALAGIRAAASNMRRAVLLVRSRRSAPTEGHDPHDVRQFLGVLQVPLHVWEIVPEDAEEFDGDPWGEAESISSLRQFNRRVRSLSAELEDQFVVWLDGDFFPNRVTLTDEASERFRLAGGPSGRSETGAVGVPEDPQDP